MRALVGGACTVEALAPDGASEIVKAQIAEVLEKIREVCQNNAFIAVLRGDDGWIFIPILGTDGDRNLCTIWPKKNGMRFDVIVNEGDGSNSRPLDDDTRPEFWKGLRSRYVRLSEVCSEKLGLTA